MELEVTAEEEEEGEQVVKEQSRRKQKLWRDVRELSLGRNGVIERLVGQPSPLCFLRDFVLPNKPCIISHAIDHWPALSSWLSNDYLISLLKDQHVSVHFTPHGRADALVDPNHPSSHASVVIPPPSEHSPRVELFEGRESKGFPRYEERSGFKEEHSRCGNARCGHGISSKHSGINSLSVSGVERIHLSASDVDRKADVLLSSMAVMDSVSDINEEEDRLDHTWASQHSYYNPLEEEKPKELWFATAHVERLPFPKALESIINSNYGDKKGIAYAQEQNGCFLTEYSVLARDAEVHIPWATEALGCMPEAVNLWIGTEKSVTSFHKDHYENLYAVVTGEKHFTLLPPTDVHRLHIRKYPSAYYTMDEEGFNLQKHEPCAFVPWVSVDPYPPAEEVSLAKSKFHGYFNGPKPFTCTVRAGEILYLPSMWFHHVRQSPDPSGRTIALNFWYDMQFDIKYAYYNFLESFP